MTDKSTLLARLKQQPEQVEFTEVIATIEACYHYTPAEFRNGNTVNAAGTNEGSAKIFAFAQLNQLDIAQTLACFGKFYRQDVLANPQGDDHQNIRNFMQSGWQGISFSSPALQEK
ncbi:HopJ type III effector protein [Sinobacterium caligoides]|uniref:HopJ type III effector protein n=1 Tax=Sinobacterium caligoides TaxID=933926 RepID=A0A3N2DFY9_9GAMM|nr:HopJ type III effector protein [Sinobacterium caligoides]ROR98716.1 HopJ type III effector protein [Sinobacterium caligoides]